MLPGTCRWWTKRAIPSTWWLPISSRSTCWNACFASTAASPWTAGLPAWGVASSRRGWPDETNGDLRLTPAGIERCRSLQHRMASDREAAKVLAERGIALAAAQEAS
jgi:hypothetical protein